MLRLLRSSLLAAVAVNLCSVVATAQDDASSETRSIVVSGTAEMQVVPDEALFMLMIETKDLGIDSALARNEVLWAKLQTLASEMKIGREHVVFAPLEIEPEYLRKGPEFSLGRSSRQYESREPELSDYYARRHVAITLRDMSRYTEFLTRLLKLGVELSASPIMRHSNIENLREQMRNQAVTNARERAVTMAKQIGASVGEPLSISEASWGESRGGGGGMEDVYGMAQMYSGKSLPGQILVSSTVNVFFELK
jgi:uncharacterized protein